ncbi:MAG: CbtB-domain containing protein [Alphaproteobacteria bacterium]|nr:CbtB-domain containing protein [Alphaproteobacteria bacterium]
MNTEIAIDRAESVRLTKSSVAAALFGTLFGLALLYGAAFAGPIEIHNAAHDSRHSFTFPCH